MTEKFIEIANINSLTTKNIDKVIDGLGKEFITAGEDYALTIIKDAEDIEILAKDNKIVGVKYNKDGHERKRYTKTVILAEDALDSAKLLNNVGINAGEDIIYNPSATVKGIIRNIDCDANIPLEVIGEGDGFILIPYACKNDDGKDVLNIVVKSDDVETGSIDGEGNLNVGSVKSVEKGIEVAKTILESFKAKDIVVSGNEVINASNSASIGDVVDINLETSIKGLFVCDASVLPAISEYPPILSILGLSNRLGNYLENIDYDNNQFGKSDYGLGKSYGKMDGWWRNSPKTEE